VDLKGVKAIAAVSCEDNLEVNTASRKSELTVDASASEAQIEAIKQLLQEKLGSKLGPIVAVHRGVVNFVHDEHGYNVNVEGFAALQVDYRIDDACCVMPGLVWYDPISPVENRRVGYTELASYSGKAGDSWYRSDEDSAFYGSIAF